MYLPLERTATRPSPRRSERGAKRSQAAAGGGRGEKSSSVLLCDRENGEVLPGRRHLAGSTAGSAHSPAMGKLATTGGRRVTRDNEEDQAASACPCGPSGASSGCAFVAEPIRGIAPRGDAAVPIAVPDPDQGERVRGRRSWSSACARTPEDPSRGSPGPARELPSPHETIRPPLETATGTDSSLHRLHASGCAPHRQPIRGDPRCAVSSDCKERVPVTGGVQTTRPQLDTPSRYYPAPHGSRARWNAHDRPISVDDPRCAVSSDCKERVPVTGGVQTTRPPLDTPTRYYPTPHGSHASWNAHDRPIPVDDPRCAVSSDCKERVPVTGAVQTTRPHLDTLSYPTPHGSHASWNAHDRPIPVGDPHSAAFSDCNERVPVTGAVQTTRPPLDTSSRYYPAPHGSHASWNAHHRPIPVDDPRCAASSDCKERVPVTGAVQTTRPPLDTPTRYYPTPQGSHASWNAHHRPIPVDDRRCAASRDSEKRLPVPRDFEERAPVTRRAPATRSTRLLVAMAILAMCTLAVAVPTPKPNRADPLRTGLRRGLADSTGLEDVYEDAFEDVFREDERTNVGAVLDEKELEIIRRSIARGLGLKRIPDPAKANVSQAEYERAHREYLKKVQLSSDEEASRSRRSLHVFHAAAHPGNGSSRIDRGQRRHRLFFPVEIPEADGNASVDHATLRLLLHGDYTDRSELNVLLYLNTFGSRRLIVRKRVSGRDSRWLELESTVAVSSWLGTGLETLGLELEFSQDDEPVRRSFSSPVLNVFTESSESNVLKDGSSRSKRSTPEELMSPPRGRRSKCKGESKKCCRHELTVMFKDLKGFEFIVYPKTFDAGYCKGGCPPRYNPANHHALLQSLLWKEDRKRVPKPCCTPSKLDELMIVYFDENDSTQLKVSYWQNIKALECACS